MNLFKYRVAFSFTLLLLYPKTASILLLYLLPFLFPLKKLTHIYCFIVLNLQIIERFFIIKLYEINNPQLKALHSTHNQGHRCKN